MAIAFVTLCRSAKNHRIGISLIIILKTVLFFARTK
jgi:hypothetical protein